MQYGRRYSEAEGEAAPPSVPQSVCRPDRRSPCWVRPLLHQSQGGTSSVSPSPVRFGFTVLVSCRLQTEEGSWRPMVLAVLSTEGTWCRGCRVPKVPGASCRRSEGAEGPKIFAVPKVPGAPKEIGAPRVSQKRITVKSWPRDS